MTPAVDSRVKRGFVVANLDSSPSVSGRATPELSEESSSSSSTVSLSASKQMRSKEPDRNGQEMYEKERAGQKPKINVVVIGHVDAGKSTLMGHLLYDMDNVSQRTLHKYEQESKKLGKQSFMYAWILDETEEERSRGITMDVGAFHFETENKMVSYCYVDRKRGDTINCPFIPGDHSRCPWPQGLYPEHDHRSDSSRRCSTRCGRDQW